MLGYEAAATEACALLKFPKVWRLCSEATPVWAVINLYHWLFSADPRPTEGAGGASFEYQRARLSGHRHFLLHRHPRRARPLLRGLKSIETSCVRSRRPSVSKLLAGGWIGAQEPVLRFPRILFALYRLFVSSSGSHPLHNELGMHGEGLLRGLDSCVLSKTSGGNTFPSCKNNSWILVRAYQSRYKLEPFCTVSVIEPLTAL